MNLDTFPIFKRLVLSPGETSWQRPLSERQQEWLNQSLETWGQALTEGGIDNPRFVESKEAISRALENAWSSVPRDFEALRLLSEAHQNALDSLPSPNLANLAGRLKRVEKTPDSPLRTELVALLTELSPLAEAYAFLKANTRKRQVKTEEEREAERFVPPPSSSQAVAKVREVLEQAIDRAYQGLVDRYTRMNRTTIETYLQAQEVALSGEKPPRNGYTPTTHFTAVDGYGQKKVVNPHGVAFLSKVLDYDYKQFYVYKATDETWKKADADALEQATFVRDQFLYKNLVKLTPVLEAKGDEAFESISEVGQFELSRLEGEFHVQFKDQSSFRLRNAVVFVVNQYNTHFNRFPTTFHDVKLPGGEPMASPSEERMHTVFAVAAAADEGQAPRKGPKMGR